MEPYSKCYSFDAIPDLSGKVMIVTGGATGIGKETAMQLFQHNAKVYIASRSRTKFDELVEETQELSKIGALSVTSGSMEFLQLDLSDIKSCIGAAGRFLDLEKRLDVIVANAALSVVPCTLSKDGVEIQFATNHLGHFVFIHHLLDIIKTTSIQFHEARIVALSSHAHSMLNPSSPESIDFEDLKIEGTKKLQTFGDVHASLQRYARSKLANILFTRYLHKVLRDAGYFNIFVNCLNPGTIGTSTATDSAALPPWISFITSSIVRLTSIPPTSGALTTLLLATDPDIASKDLGGRYFDVGPLAGKFWYGYSWDATDSKLSNEARNEDLGAHLWEWSLDMMKSVEGR